MAVTLNIPSFKLLRLQGRWLRLLWGCCQFPETRHSNRLRCVDGFLIKKHISKNPCNDYLQKVLSILPPGFIPIDTPRRIAETHILSLRCVDALRGMGLRAVIARFARSIYTVRRGCVDLTLETLATSGLSDEHPTDWVKSD